MYLLKVERNSLLITYFFKNVPFQTVDFLLQLFEIIFMRSLHHSQMIASEISKKNQLTGNSRFCIFKTQTEMKI